jgi:RNA polymerase primary sigma factor
LHAGDAYEAVDQDVTDTPLEKLLSRLRPAQRRVIELRFGIRGDEFSTEQTAEILDLSVGQVRALERHALRRLRELASPVELRPAA